MQVQTQNPAHSNLRSIKTYLLATRPIFLTASILPVMLGSAIGYQLTGKMDVAVMVLALV